MRVRLYPSVHTTFEEFEVLRPIMKKVERLTIFSGIDTVCDVGRIDYEDDNEVSVYSPNYQRSLKLPFKEDL